MSATDLCSAEAIWTPGPEQLTHSRIADFTAFVNDRTGQEFSGYDDLWRWSTEDLSAFWSAVWDFFAIVHDGAYTEVLDSERMPGARWFAGTRLNYAEHALRHGHDEATAITSITEAGHTRSLTWGELRRQVAATARWLREHGVGVGDRVVGYLPNSAPTIVASLATSAVGAIWSACAQDYSAEGAAARFEQLEPKVLFAADGYTWRGRTHDRRDQVSELHRRLATLEHTVLVTAAGLGHNTIPHSQAWESVTAPTVDLVFERVPFDTPLWVLFSSGTTGRPKGIVHGHGGVTIDHQRLHGLHNDVRPGNRFFWYTSTNWMMWNMVASALLLGAEIVVYDGSPTYPTPARLWEIAAEHEVNVLGVSPGYLIECAKAGIEPAAQLDLSGLRTLGVTGAPLPGHCVEWVRDHVGGHVQVSSASGGTDVVSSFAGSAPITPVWPGELSAPILGVALESWDANGLPGSERVGELVITKPMPSMPLFFWNDPAGKRFHDAYFDTFPGVWRHGDWVTVTDRGSVVISGRSDSTLNRQGVRLGSADIYSIVEDLAQVREALVVGVEMPDGGYWMPLFVVLENDSELTPELITLITTEIRTKASPRHVPDEVIAVPAIPHTRTGKRLEVPVKRLIQGSPPESVATPDAIEDWEVFRYYERFTHRSSGEPPTHPAESSST